MWDKFTKDQLEEDHDKGWECRKRWALRTKLNRTTIYDLKKAKQVKVISLAYTTDDERTQKLVESTLFLDSILAGAALVNFGSENEVAFVLGALLLTLYSFLLWRPLWGRRCNRVKRRYPFGRSRC